MKSDLVLVFTSPDRPGIVEQLTTTVVQFGGNWEESRLARLCGDFAGIARISVDQDQINPLQEALQALGNDGLQVHVRSAQSEPTVAESSTAQLICSGADHEGIVSGVARHLASLGINVEEMETGIEPAPTTGTPLFQMACQVRLPQDLQLDELSADLNALAGELGVDIAIDGNTV